MSPAGPPDSPATGAAAARAGLVTGLADEARVLRRALPRASASTADPDDAVRCAGADTARARAAARGLVEAGAAALVSFGVAGGLDPACRPGDLVLATEVVLPGGRRVATHAALRAGLLQEGHAAGLSPLEGALLGSDIAVAARLEKRRLFAASGALAVDMESHAVAEVAVACGLPLLVVRAVADPAARALPRAVLGAVASDGRSRPGRVAARLCLTPWELPAVLRLAGDLKRALESLERLTRHGGERLLGGF